MKIEYPFMGYRDSVADVQNQETARCTLGTSAQR